MAARTQNQSFAAILFLYKHVLDRELPPMNAVRAKRPQRLPVVLSRDEVRCVLAELPRAPTALMVKLLYGTEDLDCDHNQITIREGKSDIGPGSGGTR